MATATFLLGLQLSPEKRQRACPVTSCKRGVRRKTVLSLYYRMEGLKSTEIAEKTRGSRGLFDICTSPEAFLMCAHLRVH